MSRYRVTSISGWGIRQGGRGAGSVRPTLPAWQVLDTADCYRIVAEYRREGNQWQQIDAEAAAREHAARLEQECP